MRRAAQRQDIVQPLTPLTWHLSTSSAQGPPTEFAMTSRAKFYALLALQGLICMPLRPFLLLDVIGGLLVAAIVALGLYAVDYKEMDMQVLRYYGLMNFVVGVFDLVNFLSKVNAVIPVLRIFARVPWAQNLAKGVLLFGSLLELAGAALTWRMHRDHTIANRGSYLPIGQQQANPFGKGSRVWNLDSNVAGA